MYDNEHPLPTLPLLEILREVEKHQIIDLDPVKLDFPAMELLLGGLLETKVFASEMGKKKIVLYITDLGRDYLQKFG